MDDFIIIDSDREVKYLYKSNKKKLYSCFCSVMTYSNSYKYSDNYKVRKVYKSMGIDREFNVRVYDSKDNRKEELIIREFLSKFINGRL